MAVTWPASLPAFPLVAGYTRQKLSNIEAFKPEKGPDITGPLMAKAGANVSMSFRFSNAQYAVFQNWWDTQTKGGAIPFQYFDPTRREPRRFRMQSGQSTSETPSSNARFWVVTLPLYEFP